MTMSNGVSGGVFANLADLQASRPREDTQVSLNGDVYTIDQTNFGEGIAVNSLFANPVKMTLTSLLNSTRERQAGDIVEIVGYSVAGDGGAASWKVTGNTITASQSPAQLSDAKCSDALGNEFEVINELKPEILGGVSSLDAVWGLLLSIPKKVTFDGIYTLSLGGVTSASIKFYGDGTINVSSVTNIINMVNDKCVIDGLSINGDISSPVDNLVKITGSNNKISNCDISGVNSNNTGVLLVTDGGEKNKLESNLIRQSNGSGIGLSIRDTKYNKVSGNHFDALTGFGVFCHSGSNRNWITDNIGTNLSLEPVGLTNNCNHNIVTGNIAEGSGDNGISVSGDYNVVANNQAIGNSKAGIWAWGAANAMNSNVSVNNNTIMSTWAGIGYSGNFGGSGQFNVITGNSINDYQDTPTQFNSIRNGGVAYSVWATATSYTSGSDYITNGDNIYLAITTGTSGATPPTHTSGEVSDGGVTWRYVNSYRNTVETRGTVVVGNGTGIASSNSVFLGNNNDDDLVLTLVTDTGYFPEAGFTAVPTLGSNPSFGQQGMLYENTSSNTIRHFNGAAWVDV